MSSPSAAPTSQATASLLTTSSSQSQIDELQQKLDQISRQIPCKFYVRQGSCLNGQNCYFSHDRETMPFCSRLQKTGHCPLEHQCRFQHPPRDASAKQFRALQAQYEAKQQKLDAQYNAIKKQLQEAKRKAAAPTTKTFHINIRKKWRINHVKRELDDQGREVKMSKLPLSALSISCHSFVRIPENKVVLVPGNLDGPSSRVFSENLLEFCLDTQKWHVRFDGDEQGTAFSEYSFRSNPSHAAFFVQERNCIFVLTNYPDFLLLFDLATNVWHVMSTVDHVHLHHSTMVSPQSAVLLRRQYPLNWTFRGEEIQIKGQENTQDYLYIVMYRPHFDDLLEDEDSQESRHDGVDSCLWALSLTSFRWFRLPCLDGPVPNDRHLATLVLRKHGLRQLDRLVLFGGWSSAVGHCHNGVFEFDVDKLEWTMLSAENAALLQNKKDADKVIYAPPGRCLHSAVLVDNDQRMVISGGTSGRHALSDIWSFSFDSFKWSRAMHSLRQPRIGHAMIVLPPSNGRNKFLVHGGVGELDENAKWLMGSSTQPQHAHGSDEDSDEENHLGAPRVHRNHHNHHYHQEQAAGQVRQHAFSVADLEELTAPSNNHSLLDMYAYVLKKEFCTDIDIFVCDE